MVLRSIRDRQSTGSYGVTWEIGYVTTWRSGNLGNTKKLISLSMLEWLRVHAEDVIDNVHYGALTKYVYTGK